MTIETVFVTQVVSIIGFIVVLFVLYRILIEAKVATIETLQQQINLLNQKLSEFESQEPDLLIQVLQRKTAALEKELKERIEVGNLTAKEADNSIAEVELIEKKLATSELVLEKGLEVTKRARAATAAARQYLLKVYEGHCQVCGACNGSIMELAHIKPFRNSGESSISNMLLLCPNDHRLFDKGEFGINSDLTLIGRHGKLTISKRHEISRESLQWHRENVLIKSA